MVAETSSASSTVTAASGAPDTRSNLELVTIYEISKLLSSSLDLSKTLHEVLNVLSIHLDTRHAMISLLQDSGELHLVGASGLTPDEIRRGRYRRGEGVTGKILQSGMPVVVADIAKEPRFLNRIGSESEALAPGEAVAFVGVPIKAGREVLGVLSINRVVTAAGHGFAREVRFLTMIANLVGQTVRLYRRVAAEHMQVLEERRQLQKALHQSVTLDNIVGTSPGMRAVFAEVHKAAPSRSTILIRGESGTGKEAIARAIHSLSPRRDKPFITLNCAALSETLLESELFGHEKGAFTGAHAERKGRFELAHGGTLFLDEIGEVSPTFQAKLLRVLQEREFERVGGNRPVKVDVRLICATNRDLERAVGEGSFRSDLYFRINVISVTLPPLRERRDDIPLLAEHFIAKFNRENDRGLSLSPGALEVLRACYWPGNVRELENCIERTATMTNREAIAGDDFPCTRDRCLTRLLHQTDPEAHVIEVVPIAARASAPPAPEAEAERPAAPPTAERERVVQALEQCGWVQAKAARLLGITPRQLGYALQKHGIVVKKF